MRKYITFVALSSLALANGENIYKNKCASCNEYYVPVDLLMDNFMNHNNKKLNLKAPTVNQLNFRLKQMIGEPKGDLEFHRVEVTGFIKSYLITPDKQKSVCMPEVINNFGTMKSMKNELTSKEMDDIADWIYDYKQPKDKK